MPDSKGLAELLQEGLHEIRQIAQRAEEEAKKLGEPLADTRAAMDKLHTRIDEIEQRLEREHQIVSTMNSSDPAQEERRRKIAPFFKWMRVGRNGMSDEEYNSLFPEHRRALVENEQGEILVPEILESEIYRELPKLTVIRQLATVRTITRGNRVRRRSLNEVTMGWGKLETGKTLTESTLEPGEEWQYVEDLYGLTKVGEDELADTDIALEPIITDSFARARAEMEDTAFVIGRGHAQEEPEGILNGTVVPRVDAGQAGAITADDLITLSEEVPEQYQRNGVYIVNRKTRRTMRLLKDKNDQYLWQPSLIVGTPPTFNGFPVYTQNDVPEIPDTGAADVAIFGDIRSGYRVLDRLGLTMRRLLELYAEQGLVGFMAHYRVGGGVIRPNAIRILRVPSA